MNVNRIANNLALQISVVNSIVAASDRSKLMRERQELISQARSIRLTSEKNMSREDKAKRLEEIKKRIEALDDQIKNETKFGFEIYHNGDYQGFSKEETLEDDLAQLGLEKNQVKLVRKPLLNQ